MIQAIALLTLGIGASYLVVWSYALADRGALPQSLDRPLLFQHLTGTVSLLLGLISKQSGLNVVGALSAKDADRTISVQQGRRLRAVLDDIAEATGTEWTVIDNCIVLSQKQRALPAYAAGLEAQTIEGYRASLAEGILQAVEALRPDERQRLLRREQIRLSELSPSTRSQVMQVFAQVSRQQPWRDSAFGDCDFALSLEFDPRLAVIWVEEGHQKALFLRMTTWFDNTFCNAQLPGRHSLMPIHARGGRR
ncbi:MAG: hypothetical protein NZT92_09595 [Abditibacteriales bacterium]|nr:hypothetical protein [Abditibacteriales bacterium]